MYIRTKYVITKDKKIIVFPEMFNHSDFIHFQPISAGFISFGVNKNGNPSCSCYGESISLKLKSNEEVDTELAKRQLNMMDEY
jgi:hypothetical protein